MNDIAAKNNKKYYARNKEFAIFRNILLEVWKYILLAKGFRNNLFL
jgi:hypothetical protein